MDLRQQWATLLHVAAAAQSVAEREAALALAMGLAPSVTPAAVGCSVTERTGLVHRTAVSFNAMSTALDEAQYEAQAGPCLTAADRGVVERVDSFPGDPGYRHYAAVAVAHGVASSVSIPVPDPRWPAALNLYASAPDAFGSEHAMAVATLLARCIASLSPGFTMAVPIGDAGDLGRVRSRRTRMEHVLHELMDSGRLSRAEAFAVLARRSGVENRSIHTLVDDLFGGSDRTVVS
jgi:hypothetical protein